MTIFEIIKSEIHTRTGKTVTETTYLKELGIDSLELLDFVVELEKKFHIRIDDNELVSFQTIGDIVKAVEKLSQK